MLSESQAAPQALPHRNNPPHKRRRVGERGESKAVECTENSRGEVENTATMPLQTVYDLDASEEESEPEWEDVELPSPSASSALPSMLPAGHDDDQEPLHITLGKEEHAEKTKSAIRRKPITGAEKKLRLEIHKVHVLCLLGHVQLRNVWCNDEEIQALQYSAEILQSKDDFRKHARMLQGSRDFGAQLYCAMLRGVGVDARLVCSLQALPFAGVAKGESPRKRAREYIVLSEDDIASSSVNTGTDTPASDPPPRRRLGQPQFSSNQTRSPAPQARIDSSAPTTDSSFPVFWVEAFNRAMQKWVCVDPLVTNSVGKPTRFEPPASDKYNNMNYVIAFNEDGFARDVTRRYTKSFNSKTRKTRVEYTKDGERWWNQTMQVLESPFPEDRDQLELGEFAAKAAGEGMPKSVQDFKNHPVYALERHLRWNEVIHPKREIGRVGLSKLSLNKKAPPMEPVYRRADVHPVKSADGWYRQGRKVKAGEQPLKRIKARNQVQNDTFNPNEEEEAPDTPMYAAYQTELYIPEPVVDNRVPRNQYGNIDVYISSMVPAGGFHLSHPDAAQAAKILQIDYADAVTGFKFKKRHGTAVIDGIVAAVEYRDALKAVVAGINDERVQAEETRRTMAALHMWRLLLIKLRVLERVNSYRVEGEEQAEKEPEVHEEEEQGGGFLPDDGTGGPALPTGGDGAMEDDDAMESIEPQCDLLHDSFEHSNPQERAGGGFMVEPGTSQQPSGINPAHHLPQTRRAMPSVSQSWYTLVIVPKAEHGLRDETSPSLRSRRQGTLESTSSQPADGTHSVPVVVDTPEREVSGLPELVHVDSDSEIDRSSMISHDPEDDNAEPEWLLSD
ncbi:nitrilase [Arthroderma uncinatum]|uniref:nitrilase n=1 Tax=Arthroderma uncinatum TaxID=74035 RepID=UPI00144A7B77|nr:nitrilase [Arthroderma uncinatum]KAF3491356.1 nitrilase [Arthroderma uncinatum]